MYHLGGKKPFHNQQSSFSRGKIIKEINFLSLFLYLVKSIEFPLDVDDGTLMSVAMATACSIPPDDCCLWEKAVCV